VVPVEFFAHDRCRIEEMRLRPPPVDVRRAVGRLERVAGDRLEFLDAVAVAEGCADGADRALADGPGLDHAAAVRVVAGVPPVAPYLEHGSCEVGAGDAAAGLRETHLSPERFWFRIGFEMGLFL
tara:strand:- start:61 stop:435 length:375 start_codon:yes stop_codon:yes gene_type:complete